ncbi:MULTISPECIES: NADP-dependent oxidoreductase [Pseudomonas syringae group]|uniref:Oxidoreductase zinc-binding protein n=1 Tax=Pseudomonas syringae pv. primulae TaxID=251707 RepID=A0A0P9Y1V4_9PSED|nr:MULTISPECIES: NADP-dependent oxidoreductase [Pseudomonas syringae group]KPY35611.1 Oxidoreductase zinc-binding protein [Pseudomonas syringae pv. primulae]MBD8186883.1 NADP-dependent oxidoreductase [Pseudomonas viridiflava]MBD8200241.1 NADP-dependent oxidoreductase [Pseudomonas viridiflava]TKJ66338.1 NADP-dependent oxidoreductase [Pseudomonas viridiflava]TKK34088.1 NADP-dependent oxidoreductase [Pseudomonas viridiflava]
MTDLSNRQFLLAKRPSGAVRRDDFTYQEVPVPALADGQILLRNKYLSLDPAMRGWMNEGKSYIPPVQLGEVMRALGVGEVIESKNPKFAKGDHVQGAIGVQDYFVGEPKGFYKVDTNLAPLPLYLSALGMTGMTAYFALLDVGLPKSGDTVVISGAAGAVGSIAGQIAKLKGCRVVGIAGGKEKCSLLTEELGFDAAIDYKAESDIHTALKRECPDGVNVYFDNVGGDILDAVLSQLAVGARVVICGAISQYNSTTAVKGPANYLSLLVNRARMEGFVVLDHAARFGEAGKELAGWVKEGKIKSKEHIEEGLETFPETLLKLFSGENFGKLMLKVD